MIDTSTHLPWGLLLGGLLALAPAACGGGTTGTGGASSSTSATTGATTAAGSGGSRPLAACDVPAARPSNGACYRPPPLHCNPVTGAPCKTGDGESCDVAQGLTGGYQCYPAPNDAALCGPCEELMSPFCGAGLTCLSDGSCAGYCCDDGDCGTGKCDKTLLPAQEMTVGVCVHR